MQAALVTALILLSLGACAGPGEAVYPRLLPLSQLNAPPAMPAHAAEAAADPRAVSDAIASRGAATRAHAGAALGPVTDSDALLDRAEALRRRAEALRAPAEAQTLPACPPGSPDPAVPCRAD